MTAAAQKKAGVRVIVDEESSTLLLDDARVEVSADGKKVTAYTDAGVEARGATPDDDAAHGTNINISSDFNKFVLNGVCIERAADGHLVVTAAAVTVVHKQAAANDANWDAPAKEKAKTAEKPLRVGQMMEDGTKFTGMSPDTGKPMFVAPADEPATLSFNAAAARAAEKSKETGKEYRIPSQAELNAIFNNRAALGGFNDNLAPWYWSSTSSIGAGKQCQSFRDGSQGYDAVTGRLSVRLVRR